MANNHGQILRQLLAPAADEVGADFDLETIWMHGGAQWRSEWPPEAIAFGLLHCGGQILAAKTYRDEFPARNRRVARKGARLLRQLLGEPETVTASIVLARSQARLMAERLSHEGENESARAHDASADFLLEYFPLEPHEIERQDRYLEASFAEARRLRRETLPDHAAPEAMAAQRFQQSATFHALELALGPDYMEKNRDALILPGIGAEALVAGQADARGRWIPIDEKRMLYVRAGYERDYF